MCAHNVKMSNQANATYKDLKKQSRYKGTNFLASARARLLQARAQLGAANYALNAKTVRAPKAGMIEQVFYQKGEFVPPLRPVTSMVSPDQYKVVFFIVEKNLTKVKEGQTIKVAMWPLWKKPIQRRLPTFPIKLSSHQIRYLIQNIGKKLTYKVQASLSKKVGQPFSFRSRRRYISGNEWIRQIMPLMSAS